MTGEDEATRLATAIELQGQGRLGEASRAYAQIVERDPANPEALHRWGQIGLQVGRPDAALDLISRAIAAKADEPAMYANRGMALAELRRFDEAIGDYDRALALQPDMVELLRLRGEAELALGHPQAALETFGRLSALAPERSDAHLGLSSAWTALGDLERALAACETAAALDPASLAARFNRGNLLRALGRVDEAIGSYEAAIALKPDFAIAHHNRAFCLLQRGDLAAGFEAYEWRRRCPTFDDPRYRLDRPWSGEELTGRTLFIYPELFQGDLIQFCRYAAMAEWRGARVRLAAPAQMHALLRTLSPTIELLPQDATPDFDVQCALLSLPRAFGTTLEILPGASGYLHADPQRVARWRARIGGQGFKVGVVWQGSTQPYALPLQRSFPLAALRGVAQVPGVRLISLQKVNGLDQLATLPAGMAVETLGEDFDPGPDAFVDTAAAIACCDLVISMDTSVAHLAGALGARTWVALPHVADWRWLMGRTDSPWYPATRLFRQRERGVWDRVFAEMEAALRGELGA